MYLYLKLDKIDPQFLTSCLNNCLLNKRKKCYLSKNLSEINKYLDECYKEFKYEGRRFFYLKLDKIKNNETVEQVLTNFSSYLFLNTLKENQNVELNHDSFLCIIAIEGIDKYLKNMDEIKKAEILDFLADFQRGHIGGIMFYGCSSNTIKELTNRKFKIVNITVSDEKFKEEFCSFIYSNYSKFHFFSKENLELIYKIFGNKTSRMENFFNQFVIISKDPTFIYNNFYIKSI